MLHVERIEAKAGALVVWTIDRPESKNALDHGTLNELRTAITEAGGDASVRAAVLTSTGQTFASGGDLRELRDRDTAEDAAHLSDLGFELCRGLDGLHFPVLCALPGAAIGGGAELALACDMRVADARATIAFKHVRMGVTTAWGTVPRLVAAVGSGVAARLLFTAHEIGATEAKGLGLVDAVTENGLARTTALAWASDVALGSPRAVAEMKRLLRAGSGPDARALERHCFADTWTSADHREAVTAYFERRPPRW